MAYNPTTWTTGDTITATAMNNIEQGIANAGGSPWDAVIHLEHANNSGLDTSANLTPSIVSGSFAQLKAILDGGGYPCILVEYHHPFGASFSSPMGYITYVSNNSLSITVAGFSFAVTAFAVYGTMYWTDSDSIAFV